MAAQNFEKVCLEIIDGIDRTSLANVNHADSVEYRLIKAFAASVGISFVNFIYADAP